MHLSAKQGERTIFGEKSVIQPGLVDSKRNEVGGGRWCRHLVKCVVLGNIFDNDEQAVSNVWCEIANLFLRKALLDNERTVTRLPCFDSPLGSPKNT